ncbi:MAG: binding-protein-dependent transport system inner rane component [Frankiales bacterium]|nr:binding-protein-dependent transport system inner rane component [Frankiales bacterium]
MALAPALAPVPAAARRRSGPRYPRPLLAAVVVVVLLTLVPLGFLLSEVARTGAGGTWSLLARPRTGELLSGTLRLLVASTVACTVLGTAGAWLLERSDLPWRRGWSVLLALPLAVPAFVNGFGWVSLTPSVQGYGGAVLITTLSYYPLVLLPVAAALRGLDPALEEVAATLGHGPWRTFAGTVLPQLRPALLGGALLVGLHLLAEFGALALLRFPTLTTGVYDAYRASFGGAAATALALPLALLCLVLLVGESRLRGSARLARVGSGTVRTPALVPLGRGLLPLLAALVALVALALGVPAAALVRWTVEGSSTAFPAGALLRATASTLGLAALAAGAVSLLALPVAWLVERYRGAASVGLERAVYAAGALPGIVVALSLVGVTLRLVRPAYQTTGLLVAAYAVLFLPRAVVGLRAAVAQAPPVLDDVARSLGAGPLVALRRVTLPLLAPGLGAGAALVFLAVVTELTATLLLAPIGVTTLATEFWAEASELSYGAAAPYAALMVLLSAPATLLLTRGGAR